MIRFGNRAWRAGVVTAAVTLALVTACGENGGAGASPVSPQQGGAPVAAAPQGLVPVDVAVPGALAGDEPFDEKRQALLPQGWTMSVWAKVDKARMAVWAPDGTLLVSQPDNGSVVRLTRSGDTATSAPLLTGLNQPHGMTFANGRLLVAESDAVRSYTYADGRAGSPQTIVDGLPDAKSPDLRGKYAHALKSVAVGPDGSTYVSVGSTGNISAQDRQSDPERAAILRVPPGGGRAETFAKGVRNGTGLAIAPDGAVWTAVNNRDNIPLPQDFPGVGTKGQVVPDYVDDHPPEELAKLTPGRDLGWPYCNPDPGPPGQPLKRSALPFVADAETNPDGSRLNCASLPALEQTMGAHSAPLGMAFVRDLPGLGDGALVGVHGSWNRQDPRAPEVSFYPYRAGGLGDQQTLVGGFQDAEGKRWGRPVAAVTGPDGAVYVTDDEAGAVYRVVPPRG